MIGGNVRVISLLASVRGLWVDLWITFEVDAEVAGAVF